MSTIGQFVWNFDEGTINKFEALLEDGRFKCAEILKRTPGAVQSKATHLGLKENRIAIYCKELDKSWSSVWAASKDLNISHNLICRVLTGVQNQTHNLHFEYLTDKQINSKFLKNWNDRTKHRENKTTKKEKK